ncbi:MAG: hypothetical protein ACRD04_02265 [Terriglobales bacterium]
MRAQSSRLLRRMRQLLRPGRAAELADEMRYHRERKQAEEGMSARTRRTASATSGH